MKKVNSITLKSVEIPLILNKIRSLNGTTSISFTFTYNSYINITVSNGIVAGVYTSVSSLLISINTVLGIVMAPYTGLNLSFATTTNSSGYQICVITTNVANFNLNVSTLTTILGFLYSSNRITNTRTLLGKGLIDIFCIDPCIYVQINNIPIVNNNNFS